MSDGRQLRIGGTDEDSTKVPGLLRLFNAAGGSVSLKFDDSAPYNRSITIPNKAGDNVTLAVTDDIPTSTSTPTANEVAEFDSNAYMNSTDMTSQEVSDFVDGLSYESEVATIISDMADYVIEQGTSGIWTYKKWNSGTCEIWGRWEETLTNYATWNDMYSYSGSMKQLPFTVYDAVPTYSAKVANGYVCGCSLLHAYANPLTEIGLYASASASGSQSVLWVCNIKGKWTQ